MCFATLGPERSKSHVDGQRLVVVDRDRDLVCADYAGNVHTGGESARCALLNEHRSENLIGSRHQIFMPERAASSRTCSRLHSMRLRLGISCFRLRAGKASSRRLRGHVEIAFIVI
jgi:hypothetical protein